MKFKIIFFALALLSLRGYSQSKNTLSVVYGTISNDVNIHGSIGDFGYHPQSGTAFGLTFSHALTRSIALETGLIYSDNKTQETYMTASHGQGISNGTVKMLSIPALVNFTFLKYVYLDGGLLIDKQTNYTSGSMLNDQSGIGFELGAGGKYSFDKITVFVNPAIRAHGLVLFDNSRSNFNLLEAGFKFGVGYNF